MSERETKRELEIDSRIDREARVIAGYVGITKDPELTILVGNIRRALYEEGKRWRLEVLNELEKSLEQHKEKIEKTDHLFYDLHIQACEYCSGQKGLIVALTLKIEKLKKE